MSHDDDLYRDFPDTPHEPEVHTRFHVEMEDVQANNVLVSRRDVNFTVNMFSAPLGQLHPRPIDRQSVLSEHLFVFPPLKDINSPPEEPFPGADPSINPVLALLGPDESGRRTMALHLLEFMLGDKGEIFELYPDWEEPNAECIPREADTGYLLNLVGIREPLSAEFHEQLIAYALQAQAHNTRLIIIGPVSLWHGATADSRKAGINVMSIERPSTLRIARQRIMADVEGARVDWLDDSTSVFTGLLKGGEPPGEGVRLADIILKADGPHDSAARDRFLGWSHQLGKWFGSTDTHAPERRAMQIAAAFLDGSPARTVLDAADVLLTDQDINWPVRKGGPLAGGDDTDRCSQADLDFADDGTVSISRHRPGINHALLVHIWRRRPQMVPVLVRWMSEISRPAGVADGSQSRLVDALILVAKSEGPDVVFDLARQWLLFGKRRYIEFAVDMLDRLAVDPLLGSSIRRELANWARSTRKPELQRAVVEVCGGQLGLAYPSMAMTRLKYVLDRARDTEVRATATATLRELLRRPELFARVLSTLVAWASSSDPEALSRTAFLDVFAHPDMVSAEASPRGLLSIEGDAGEAVVGLLGDGWRAVWQHPELRSRAADVLAAWCDAVGPDGLPDRAVEEIVSEVFREEADALGDDLHKIIGGSSPFRDRLRTRFVGVVRDAAQSPGSPAMELAPTT